MPFDSRSLARRFLESRVALTPIVVAPAVSEYWLAVTELPNPIDFRTAPRPQSGSLLFWISDLMVGLVELAQPSAISCCDSGANMKIDS